MTKAGYYPGCSLEATARDYAESLAGVAQMLDLELVEVPDWNCCGATAGHSLDHRLALNLAARNLALARPLPQPLVVPCALCFNRLKSAQAELVQDPGAVIGRIASLGQDYAGVEVVELNQYLTSPAMLELAAGKAVKPLAGLRPAVYYGCQGQRPPRITGQADYENPTGIDRLLSALGARVVDWSGKTDCCGASHAVARPDIVHTLVGRLYQRALQAGANCLVTGCQMCQGNLDLYQARIAQELGQDIYLPAFYFTELLGLALGHRRVKTWLGRHMTSPGPLLEQAGLRP